jgi:high-affinity nickel-transport protein
VAICFVIGVVEALSLLPQEIHGLSRTTGFWGLISRFNINTAGFVIVGLLLATWLAALLIWRYARIEQKWSPAPQSGTPDGAGCRGTYALVQDTDEGNR